MRTSTKIFLRLRRPRTVSPALSFPSSPGKPSPRFPLRSIPFTSPLLRQHNLLNFGYTQCRYESTHTGKEHSPRPLTDRIPNAQEDARIAQLNAKRRAEEPAYRITFTCNPCKQRSSHQISKHGYHKGTVLIQCPHCSNRHIISDHLGIFMDNKGTVEDILAKQGRKVTKGHLDGGLEVWDDGTVSDNNEKLCPETDVERHGSLP
jgi:mitochondrial protein import protein ZIM17